MIVVEKIPIYHGGWMDVFWEENAKMDVRANHGVAEIIGNRKAFHSLAKQLLYYYINAISNGVHVHYSDFFCGTGLAGLELIIALEQQDDYPDILMPDDNYMTIAIDFSQYSSGKICPIWDNNSKMTVTCEYDSVVISGNAEALYSLAKQFLFYCHIDTKDAPPMRYNYEVCRDSLIGIPLVLQLSE